MLVNFASETISAGGTGNLTVSGAVDSAHVTLNNAIGLDHYFNYVIKDGNNREEGIGHLSASTTVVRDLALETIVSGTLDNTSPSFINVSTSATISINAASHGFMAAYGQYYDTVIGGCEGVSCNMFATGISSYSLGMSADVAYLTPCYLPYPKMVSNIDLCCKVSAASGGAHVGAYRMASNGQPGTLFADFTNGSPFDCSTTGTKQKTLGTPVLFPGGQFWMCILVNNATLQFRGLPFAQCANHNMGLDTGSNAPSMLTKGTTYGNLPSSFPSFASNSTGQFCFWIS